MRNALRALVLAIAFGCAASAADETPAWIKDAAARPLSSFPAKVTSVVLLRDEAVTVEIDGRRVMRERGVIKILQPNGDRIEAYRTYNTRTGRIRSFQAWRVAPDGKPTVLPQNSVLDVALSDTGLYDEARAKVLGAGNLAVGSIFAWEIVEEEKTVFTQDAFFFQQREPVVLSRFALTLPQGWEMKASVFNSEAANPAVAGTTTSWELKDLPAIDSEDYSPSVTSLVPRVAISYFPPSGNAAGLQGLKDWASVSTWLAPIVDPPAQVTDKVRAKALQLTAGLSGDLEKIRAIGAFAQQTNYVAISMNITRGGGYTPHNADEVLTRNYGDCKDKATLMRSLLKAVGIDAYLTVISADDRNYVRAEWASPSQFNHAIIAIRVPDSIALPTVLNDPTLGRLLLFDPTDPITSLGDLPEDEQGSHALVIAGARGALLTMPRLLPAASRIDSDVEGSLDAAGKLDAQVRRQFFGQSGVGIRAVEKLKGAPELKKRFERTLARRIPGATLAQMSTALDASGNIVDTRLQIHSDQFGQVMQGKLLILRPGLLSSGGEYFLPSTKRTTAIELTADVRHDSVHIKVPAGFAIDEMPAPAKIVSPYGTMDARWTLEKEKSEIVLEETLTIFDTMAPASEYSKVREFFELVAGAHAAPVVLVK